MNSLLGKEKADAVIKMLCAIALAQRNNQEEIDNSITEQLNIVQHIQEILHIQRQYIRGHESQERKPVDIRSVINDSLSMLFGSIEKMAIAVYLDVPEKLPAIKGDRTRLMQVMLNVLKNSIESIDINAPEKNISFSSTVNNDQLMLKIKDNGNGFDKEIADRLFKRGFTTKSSGTGLGLYNCKAIIESHEGTIDITSEGQGKGSVITIGFKLTA
jgi:signal transduction histidine kinase